MGKYKTELYLTGKLKYQIGNVLFESKLENLAVLGEKLYAQLELDSYQLAEFEDKEIAKMYCKRLVQNRISWELVTLHTLLSAR